MKQLFFILIFGFFAIQSSFSSTLAYQNKPNNEYISSEFYHLFSSNYQAQFFDVENYNTVVDIIHANNNIYQYFQQIELLPPNSKVEKIDNQRLLLSFTDLSPPFSA